MQPKTLGISIIIPNYNGQQLLVETINCAIEALVTSGITDYEIIVTDDASSDDSELLVKKTFPGICFLKSPINTGFSGNVNRGIQVAQKELVLLLNSDVHLAPAYFIDQIPLFEDVQTFGVMGKILDQATKEVQDGAKAAQINGLRIESNKNIYSGDAILPTLFLSGANALIRRAYLTKVSGLNELFNPYYSEDVELGLRAWRFGFKLYYQPKSICYHALSSTIKKLPNEKVQVIAKRNKHYLHFLHLPFLLNWCYLISVFIRSFAQLLAGRTLHWKAFYCVMLNIPTLLRERRKLAVPLSNQGLQSVFQVKKTIHHLLENKSKEVVPS
ncbi:MAG: glycosyltransferase family 2 protein [Flavobacteriales bacterium]